MKNKRNMKLDISDSSTNENKNNLLSVKSPITKRFQYMNTDKNYKDELRSIFIKNDINNKSHQLIISPSFQKQTNKNLKNFKIEVSGLPTVKKENINPVHFSAIQRLTSKNKNVVDNEHNPITLINKNIEKKGISYDSNDIIENELNQYWNSKLKGYKKEENSQYNKGSKYNEKTVTFQSLKSKKSIIEDNNKNTGPTHKNLANNNKNEIIVGIDEFGYNNPEEAALHLNNNKYINLTTEEELYKRGYMLKFNQYELVKKRIKQEENNNKFIKISNTNNRLLEITNINNETFYHEAAKVERVNNTTNTGSLGVTQRSLDKVTTSLNKNVKFAVTSSTSFKDNQTIKDNKSSSNNILEQDNIINNNPENEKDKINTYVPINIHGKCEIFAYYNYCYKKFPPGREQFSFSIGGDDIVLYGGVHSNKNNSIWGLNPSKIILI